MAPFEVVGGSHPADLRSGQPAVLSVPVHPAHHQSGRDRQGRQDSGHRHSLQGEQPGRGEHVDAGARSDVRPAGRGSARRVDGAGRCDRHPRRVRRELLDRRLARPPRRACSRSSRSRCVALGVADDDLRAGPPGAARATAHAGRRAPASDPERRRRRDPRTDGGAARARAAGWNEALAGRALAAIADRGGRCAWAARSASGSPVRRTATATAGLLSRASVSRQGAHAVELRSRRAISRERTPADPRLQQIASTSCARRIGDVLAGAVRTSDGRSISRRSTRRCRRPWRPPAA